MYFWCWTSNNRAIGIAVLNQMCRGNYLNITFHDDSIKVANTWNSRDTIQVLDHNLDIKDTLDKYEERSVGNMPIFHW